MFSIGTATMSTLETIVRYVAITHATTAQTMLFTTFDPTDYAKIPISSTIRKWTDGFGEYTSIQSLLETKASDTPLLCVLDTTILLVLPFDAANANAPYMFLQDVPVSRITGAPLFNNQDGTDRRLVNRSVIVTANSANWWPHIPDTYTFKDAQSRVDVACYGKIPDGKLNQNGQGRHLVDLAVSAYGFYGRFRPKTETNVAIAYDSDVYLNRTMFPYWNDSSSGGGIGVAFVRGSVQASTASQTYHQLDYIRWGYTNTIDATRLVICSLTTSLLSSASFQFWMYPTSEFVSGVLLCDSCLDAPSPSCVVFELSRPTAFRYFEWKNTTPDLGYWRSNFGIYLA
jgi:hypothetical protein